MNKTLIILAIYIGSACIGRALHRKLYQPGGVFQRTEPGIFDMLAVFLPGLNTVWAIALCIILTIETLVVSKNIKTIAKRILGL